jgi:hypothetical protein
VSEVARTAEYRTFSLDILQKLPQFHEAYNGGLRTFRRVHHEKNAAQPMPDLGRDGERWEMPFWVWRREGRRQRLWASQATGRFSLFVDMEAEPFATIAESSLASGGSEAVALLEKCEAEGTKIRPRALTLTLFARLFVGDVFIHGLGGAIYDKVTDEIVRSYYRVEPPQAVMATGTVLLPLRCLNVTECDRVAQLRRLRDIRHNAERLMDGRRRSSAEARRLIERKAALVATSGPSREDRQRVWQELHEVNGRLSTFLENEPAATRLALEEIRRKLALNKLLKDREYPFVLYPRDELIAFYNEVTKV